MKQLILLMAGFAAFHAAAAGHYSAAEADFPAVCATAADSLPPVDTLANEPYLLADPMPSFNGNGTLDFCRWVQEHLRYPYEAVVYGIEGRVVVGRGGRQGFECRGAVVARSDALRGRSERRAPVAPLGARKVERPARAGQALLSD